MNTEQQIIRSISDRLVKAQEPIRILDAIKWDDKIKDQFFANKCKKLPEIDENYYAKQSLGFDPEEKIAEFKMIKRDCINQLGQLTTITQLITRRIEDYCRAINMLSCRGNKEFSEISKELYGGPNDAFYLNGPRLSELGELLDKILKSLNKEIKSDSDEKKYDAETAQSLLQKKLGNYFCTEDVRVKISDQIIADAAAGADSITLNQHIKFSERDIRYLEVHEGWVHVGTTLNGLQQPYCTFLAKGSPASSVTQEGLAVITEVFTFSSYPARMLKLTNRIKAIDMVNHGANFIDIFRFFKEQGYNDNDCYNHSSRVFRGSFPKGGPFTKDLSYAKGFILIYNYIRLAVQNNLVQHVPLLFVGKTLLEEIAMLANLLEQGLIIAPNFMPPQFRDLAALSSWMSFSLYLNKFDLEEVAKQYYSF